MRTLILSIVFIACQQSIKAQPDPSPGFLWQVNIHGAEFTLAGSIHAGKKDLYPLPEAYIQAYQKADNIIFEVKDDFESIREQLFTYAEKDRLQEDQYLDHFLSTESKEMLARLFKENEGMLQRYYSYEGWLLNMAIMGMAPRLIGYDPEWAVDKYFHDLATRDQKQIIGLDEIEAQFKLFEFEFPIETQLQILETGLETIEMRAHAEKPLFDNYYSQNTEAFRKAFLTPMDFDNPQVNAMYQSVFANRNKSWVNQLIELSKTHPGNYFMLVGCGHYFGPENVLELLKKEGFIPREYRE